MPVDHRYLKGIGISAGAYKRFATSKNRAKEFPRFQDLMDLTRDRQTDSCSRNMREQNIYRAIDLAHEAPFNQTTATMVREMMKCDFSKLSPEQLQARLASFGLSKDDLFLKQRVEKDGEIVEGLIPNVPVFFQVLVPIVVAYHSIRTAKLYNERDKTPLFPFVPLKQTDKNRVICDIWTDIVETICTWYGYPAYLKQAIMQMLKYGICLAFPMEEWHYEYQVIGGNKTLIKEGLRYVLPHPSRMGYDLYHPTPTFNTDTGCEWGFHWSVVPYSHILENRLYWNKKSIPYPATNSWYAQPAAVNYFREAYPCVMSFPSVGDESNKRENKATHYNNNNRDSSILLANHFVKIVPADWGLGEYKDGKMVKSYEYPVWHRIIMAGDDTPIWMEPCAYNPIWFMGYDHDSQAGVASSFSLECIPWQDQVGNILSQMLLTSKQNLKSVTWYDINIVNPKDIQKLENKGESRYRDDQFIGFDGVKMAAAGLTVDKAFFSPTFQWRNVNELQMLLNSTLNIMERLLQMSAQETGAAAQHYQSAKEIGHVAASTGQRLAFTGSGVDEGSDAWRRQIKDAYAAYGERTATAQVSIDIPDYEKHLADLGFKIEQKGVLKVVVAGPIKNLAIETFARSNTGPVQSQDPAMAAVIFQTIGVLFQSPELVAAVGVPRVIKLLERGAKLGGAPQDFDLTTPANGGGADMPPEAMIAQLKPILEQLQQSTLQIVTEKFIQPIAQENADQEQQIVTLEETVAKFDKIFEYAEAAQNKLKVKAEETQQAMTIKDAEFRAEQARLEEQHQAELRRKKEQTDADIQAELAKTSVDLQVQKAQSDAKIDTKKAETKVAIESKKKVAAAAPKKKPAAKK